MGRKANTKKIIREFLKEEKAKKKNKNKRQLKEEAWKKISKKPTKSQKKQSSIQQHKELLKLKAKKHYAKIREHKHKIFGLGLAVIMLSILLSIGFLLFQKAYRAMPIAKILPADSTVFLAEVNTNFDHNQVAKTFNLLAKYPEYSKESVLKKIEDTYKVSYEKDLKPWLGRQAGLALVSPKDQKSEVNSFYFAETLNEELTNSFLQNTLQAKEKERFEGHQIYTLPNETFATFIEDYLVFTPSEKGLKDLLAFKDSYGRKKLYSSSKYRRIDDNLSFHKAGFVYVDFDQMSSSVFQYFQILSERGLSMESLAPFIKMFEAEGFALVAMEKHFAVESFLTLDTDKAKDSEYLSFSDKYSASLSQLVSENILAFWGGQNLEHQLKRFVEVMAGGNQATVQGFELILQNYTERYLGKGLNLKDDILPLFQREFAIALEQDGKKNIYKLLIELEDVGKDALKIHEIADNFAMVGAFFKPKVVEHTLPDGTVGREIIAVPEAITKEETKYGKTTIYALNMGQREWGIYYAIVNNIGVISTRIEGVKNTIDIAEGKKKNLSQSPIFTEDIVPILSTSDEVSYFNIEKLLPIFFQDKETPKFLNTIKSLSSGKNYFNDGITSINYLQIK